MSALQRNVLLLELSTLQGPELHLNVSALQRSVPLLEVSATGPELHLDVCTTEECAASAGFCTTEPCAAPELHQKMTALQRPMLLL